MQISKITNYKNPDKHSFSGHDDIYLYTGRITKMDKVDKYINKITRKNDIYSFLKKIKEIFTKSIRGAVR